MFKVPGEVILLLLLRKSRVVPKTNKKNKRTGLILSYTLCAGVAQWKLQIYCKTQNIHRRGKKEALE